VTSATHSSQIYDSVRSSSAAIASGEPDATAAWISSGLPPLPASAGDEASARRPTAASWMAMFFMVILRVARWRSGGLQRAVLAGIEQHATVGIDDQLVELGRRQIGALARHVRRGRERPDA